MSAYNISRIKLHKEPSNYESVKLTSSKDCAEYAKKFYHDDIGIYESFFMIIFNASMKTEAYVKISQGGISGTYVDVRLIAKYALDCLATSVVIFHNHPSGSLNPSEMDLGLTKKIKKALNFFDINLLDHIILTDDSYFSFADNGII